MSMTLQNKSRQFLAHELFFSTTDAKGIITSCNDVFVRISNYSEKDLIGKAHNIIRHPDMPKSAFRLVWSRLKNNQSVAAFVKNKANDGCYYWVVALITPQQDGFLSVRFKPSGKFFSIIQDVYKKMLEAEIKAKEEGMALKEIMDAGEKVLQVELKESGF